MIEFKERFFEIETRSQLTTLGMPQQNGMVREEEHNTFRHDKIHDEFLRTTHIPLSICFGSSYVHTSLAIQRGLQVYLSIIPKNRRCLLALMPFF